MKHDEPSRRSPNKPAGATNSSLKVGSVPCKVVYAQHDQPTVVRPIPVRPQSAGGSFYWDPAFAGGDVTQTDALAPRHQRHTEILPPSISVPSQSELGAIPPTADSDLQKIHRLLRGRYVLAIILAIL